MSELERALKAGEELLWSGKAESFKILDATNKPVFVFRSILCAVICVVVEILYVIGANSTGAGVKWALVAVLFIACAASPILFLFRSRKLRKILYAATDTRLMIVSDQVMSVDYPRIPKCAFRKDADGHTTLLCGEKAISSKPGKWRELSVFGNPGDDGTSPCQKFAFYAVDDPEGLRAALTGRVSIEETA